jgi:hypothetical protein
MAFLIFLKQILLHKSLIVVYNKDKYQGGNSMKKRLFSIALFTVILTSLLFLTQCDVIIGSGKNANVGIDLGDLFATTGNRDIGVKQGFSSVKISVSGPGMRTMEKTVSAGARYVNLSVPAGEERHFTVEAFLEPTRRPPFDKYPHLISLKARATADLRPGKFVGLSLRMTAGATRLFAVDHNTDTIFWADDISSFNTNQRGNLGFARTFIPSDMEIAANGAIWVGNDARLDGLVYADGITGPAATLAVDNITCLAMDKDADYNIDRDRLGVIDYSVIYYCLSTTGGLNFVIIDTPAAPVTRALLIPGINIIRGMAVDPWTHHLYLVGQITGAPPQEAIIEYDPFYATNATGQWQYGQIVGTPVTNTNFKTLTDIIVKDDGIFVLNQVALTDTQIPIVMKFDMNLNYRGGFGTISSDNPFGQPQFVQSCAPGKFYHPKRFFAHENEGLYIIDDSSNSFDKIVYINTSLNPASWKTFPGSIGDPEPFWFVEPVN